MENSAVSPVPLPKSCWSCAAPVGPEDHYCRNCGRGQGAYIPWQYKHWGIIVITLFGLGPFSLFFLWRSPVISKSAKFVYTAVISLATFYVLGRLQALLTYYQTILGGAQPY